MIILPGGLMQLLTLYIAQELTMMSLLYFILYTYIKIIFIITSKLGVYIIYKQFK